MDPRRTTPLLALLSVALVAVPIAQAAPSIEITSGPAVAPDYPMTVSVSGFDLVDYADRDGNADGEGHIHYLVNGEPATDDLGYATTSTTFTFEGLGVGDDVSAQLVNNDHTPIEPAAAATQEVGAGTPGFTGLVAVAGVAAAAVLIKIKR